MQNVGIWTFAFDTRPAAEVRAAAREIEQLDFDSIWFGEHSGREAFTQAGLLLSATGRLTVATGIARFEQRTPSAVAAAERTLAEAYPGRFVLGLGGHRIGGRPLETVREYLTGIAATELTSPEPAEPPRRVLAALGPRMLELAVAHGYGAHPYFVPVEHTRQARKILGPDAYLAVEQTVVLGPGAKELATGFVGQYLTLAPHHRANFRRLGFTEAEISGVSDRVVEAVVAFGSGQAVRERVQAQFEAGADQVSVQVLDGTTELPLRGWRELAEILR